MKPIHLILVAIVGFIAWKMYSERNAMPVQQAAAPAPAAANPSGGKQTAVVSDLFESLLGEFSALTKRVIDNAATGVRNNVSA